MANPEQVRVLFTTLLKESPDLKFSVHLYDILGIGLVNVYAAYEVGITSFAFAIAGLRFPSKSYQWAMLEVTKR